MIRKFFKSVDPLLILQKTIIYLSLIIFIILLYLTGVFIINIFNQEVTNVVTIVAAGLAMIVGIFSLPHAELYLEKQTNKLLYINRYNYAQAIQSLMHVLHESIDLEEIIKKTEKNLKKILNPKSISFSFEAHAYGEEVQRIKKELLVPIILEGKRISTIYLGEKISKDPYTDQDIHLLKTFSYQAAIAIEKASLYRQVKEYSEELEEKVKKRTVQIEALKGKQEQMIIDISHGLQTPLTIIKGELEFLKRGDFSKTKINVFERSISEISRFIYDLLSLARLENPELKISKTRINLSKALEEIIEYFEVLAKDKKINLTSKIEQNIYVLASKDKVEEIMTNLVSNAMKYMKFKGEKKMSIKLEKALGKAKIVVQDNGIGIAKEELLEIFSRFYRTKTGTRPGSGLGLAISKKIIENLNGNIEVSSTVDVGSLFTVSLPLVK